MSLSIIVDPRANLRLRFVSLSMADTGRSVVVVALISTRLDGDTVGALVTPGCAVGARGKLYAAVGAGVGTLVGANVGATVGANVGEKVCAAVGVAVGGGVGALVGAEVGSSEPESSSHPLPLPLPLSSPQPEVDPAGKSDLRTRRAVEEATSEALTCRSSGSVSRWISPRRRTLDGTSMPALTGNDNAKRAATTMAIIANAVVVRVAAIVALVAKKGVCIRVFVCVPGGRSMGGKSARACIGLSGHSQRM